MADSRNFRASYLEKVGIKGVEEKKSLEILLKERPLDVSKVSQFLLRFPLPASFRLTLWKVLLDVIPAYPEVQEMVEEQRRIQYDDMHEALSVMGRIHTHTPLSEIHLRMFLLYEGVLPFDESKMFQDKDNQVFLAIASTVADLADESVEIFWIALKFYNLQDKYRSAWSIMSERVAHYVKEEGETQLYTHLQSLRAFNDIPFTTWFHCCYSGILHENCVERIWDKVIGGSCQILLFVAVSLLLTLKRTLLNMKTSENIVRLLAKVAKDTGDHIVSHALELWQKYGSLLMPNAHKPDSPALLDRKT